MEIVVQLVCQQQNAVLFFVMLSILQGHRYQLEMMMMMMMMMMMTTTTTIMIIIILMTTTTTMMMIMMIMLRRRRRRRRRSFILGDSNWKCFKVGYPVDTPTDKRIVPNPTRLAQSTSQFKTRMNITIKT